MSPEQARGEPLDARSDIFSLGVLMYEMATGKLPFVGKTLAVVFDAILNHTHAPARYLNPDTPRELERVMDRMLQKRREDRYPSVRDLIADLQRCAGSIAASPPQPATARTLPPRGTAAGQAPEPGRSIAVLPFVNLSGNPENDYFGDGLAEELISALMQVKRLRVAARTSAFQFKGQSLDVREIGRQLNVSSVLEGSYRMAGDRIRISANFINVADGYQIWSDRFDGELGDVFEIQEELARTIVRALEVTLGGRQEGQMVPQPTASAEAYNHYLRGRFHWKKRVPDAIHKAVECFRQALELDPGFALACSGMADCYVMLGTYAVLPRKVVMPQAKAAAEKALQIDDSIAESHAALGVVAAIHDFEWQKAEEHFQRALDLAPDYATGRYWYAIFVLLPNGRFDEALGQAQWAAQLDPVNPAINAASALVFYAQQEYERAIEATDAALELDADNPLCNITRGWACVGAGRYQEALAAFDRCKALRIVATGGRAWALVLSGRQEEAGELLEELQQMSKQGNSQADFEMARVHVARGEKDPALACLERTYEERGGTLFWLKVKPLFHPLHGDPRFEALLRRMKLAE